MYVSTVTPPDGISRRIEIEGDDPVSAMKKLREKFPKGTCTLPRPLIPQSPFSYPAAPPLPPACG